MVSRVRLVSNCDSKETTLDSYMDVQWVKVLEQVLIEVFVEQGKNNFLFRTTFHF